MGQILWTWHMTNYGKTPANNISYSQEIKIGDKPFVLSFEEKGRDIGAPLPTGQDALATVVSSPMQKAEFEKLLRMEESVSIRILICTEIPKGGSTTQVCAFKNERRVNKLLQKRQLHRIAALQLLIFVTLKIQIASPNPPTP